MVRLDLGDSVGLGLIFAMETGVHYSNQTGGTSCLHPVLEGAYLPLCNDYSEPDKRFISPEIALSDYFEGPKWRGTGATSGVDQEDADFIDRVLAQSGLAVAVDRTRLSESHEAWVHVRVGEDRSVVPTWSGIEGSAAAILTWANSD